MQANRNLSIHLIDAFAGCVVAACLAGFVWMTMIRHDETAAEIRTLRRLIDDARRDGRILRESRNRKRRLLAQLQAKLKTGGQLPDEAPVEEYFQTLSTLATSHQLRILEQSPLRPQQYTGLIEQRYSYRVSGSWPALLRFLRAIEAADYWADVSYLKVDRGTGPEELAASQRVAVLTISLFSVDYADDSNTDGGA